MWTTVYPLRCGNLKLPEENWVSVTCPSYSKIQNGFNNWNHFELFMGQVERTRHCKMCSSSHWTSPCMPPKKKPTNQKPLRGRFPHSHKHQWCRHFAPQSLNYHAQCFLEEGQHVSGECLTNELWAVRTLDQVDCHNCNKSCHVHTIGDLSPTGLQSLGVRIGCDLFRNWSLCPVNPLMFMSQSWSMTDGL